MAQRKTTEDFITEAHQIHGELYDYSLVNYKNTYQHVDIICKKHGVFSQMPRIHIKAPNGCKCPKCALEEHPKHQTRSLDTFIQLATNVHNTKYDYSRVVYKASHIKININCNTCGHTFSMAPSMHLYGQGCPVCANSRKGDTVRLSTDEFVSRLQERYGDTFDYTDVHYTSGKDLITLRCKKHDLTFTKRGAYLLSNKFFCPQCTKELRKKVLHTDGPGIYHVNRTTLDTTKPAMLYIIQLSNNDETFYKVGVTINDVKKRYSSKLTVAGYSITIIHEIKMSLGEAISKERDVVDTYNQYKYVPTNKFSGYTECISILPTI